MLRVDKMESGFSEKALVILMDNKLIMNWQCTLIAEKANNLLGCAMKSVARRSSRMIFPLLSLEDCVQFWTPHCMK